MVELAFHSPAAFVWADPTYLAPNRKRFPIVALRHEGIELLLRHFGPGQRNYTAIRCLFREFA
jgi:hypothetical protein